MNGPSHGERPAVAVLPGTYLTPSMTFIRRQLLGVQASFRPIVLAELAMELDRFPFEDLHVPQVGSLERALCAAWRRVSGRYSVLPPSRRRAWERAIADADVRLLHAHFGPNGLAALPIARERRLPLIVTFHGYDASRLLRRESYRAALKQLFKYRELHVLAVSELMLSRLRELGAPLDRSQVFHCGIPVERFEFRERERPAVKLERGEAVQFLQVSGFVPKKGHEVTLRAFSKLAGASPLLRLTLAGDGPLLQAMRELATELGIADRVDFPGVVAEAEVRTLMAGADVFVHHSVTAPDGDEEGIPTAIMEAMATGLPVVSSRHAGIPELIEHGLEGFLADEGDVDGCLVAMESALSADAELAAQACRRVHQDFNSERQNQALVECYRRALS